MTLARGRRLIIALALLCAIGFPFVFSNPATTSIAFFTVLYVGAASAWNLFSGYSGYMALGNAVFYGSGAYFIANVTNHLNLSGGVGIFAWVPVAGLFSGLVAIPVGWLALRTRRHTFVVITIAIFFIFQLLAYNLQSVTNGSAGMQLPLPPWIAATYNDYFYFAALIAAVIAILASWLVRRSHFGLQLLAIRDDEDRARGLGVRTGRVKLTAFVLSGVLTGMCGAIYAYYLGSVYPPFAFEAVFDLTVALMAFLGGLGTVSGPVIGALLLEPLQQYLTQQFTAAGLSLILFGALFLIVIGFLPQGIVPSAEQLYHRVRSR
ncbi:MAG TPA: branched-chain amino acid ABC transporter permease [Actinospica sp.]|nr:branched-chain amino acid ABC transporter permease [Actinospica sp.]